MVDEHSWLDFLVCRPANVGTEDLLLELFPIAAVIRDKYVQLAQHYETGAEGPPGGFTTVEIDGEEEQVPADPLWRQVEELTAVWEEIETGPNFSTKRE